MTDTNADIYLGKIIASCEKQRIPRVDQAIGRVLSLLASIIKARRILEIGTGGGYSAVCIASHLKGKFTITTLEKDVRVHRIAKKNIQNTPYARAITCYHTDAIEWVKRDRSTFDYIFVDGKKSEYHLYLELCSDKLRKGGLIIFDDTGFRPQPLPPKKTLKQIYVMLLEKRLSTYFEGFNTRFMKDPRFEGFVLDISHGLTVGIKL